LAPQGWGGDEKECIIYEYKRKGEKFMEEKSARYAIVHLTSYILQCITKISSLSATHP
jgi:hypothetical protein